MQCPLLTFDRKLLQLFPDVAVKSAMTATMLSSAGVRSGLPIGRPPGCQLLSQNWQVVLHDGQDHREAEAEGFMGDAIAQTIDGDMDNRVNRAVVCLEIFLCHRACVPFNHGAT